MSILNKTVNAVASLNLITTACVVAAIGCALVLYGGVYELKSQQDLLHSGGLVAFNTYMNGVASHRLSLCGFMVESLTGQCHAYGAFLKGAGLWTLFVLTPMVAGFVLIARYSKRQLCRVPAQIDQFCLSEAI